MPHTASTHRHERGIALVLTLAILAVTTLLVLAFAISMRVENVASKNFNDSVRARQLALGAVDQALANIRYATPPPSITRTWTAVPGAVIDAAAGVFTTNLLYTLENPAGAGIVNLNAGFFITGQTSDYTLLGTGGDANITSGWENVTALIGGVNRLVGRVSYWVDVESAKVDLNQAGLRDPADINQSATTNMDLRALELPFFNNTVTFINSFVSSHSYGPTNPVFATVEEMQRKLPYPPYGAVMSNKFYSTVSTVDTNTDAFGRDRIDLTAITSDDVSASPAYGLAQNRFQDSTWATVLYPGIVASARDTLEKKYGTFGMNQILANIIDYQKPETTNPTGNQTRDADGIPTAYSGLKKTPMIDEVIVHAATNAVDMGGGLSNLVVHVFVDAKLVNMYEQDRGQNYTLKAEPLSISVTFANSPDASPATMAVSEQSKLFNNHVASRRNYLVGAFSGNSLGCAPPPEYTLTINGTPGAGPPLVSLVTVTLKRLRLLRDGSDDASIVDWMAPADFTAAWPAGMTFPNAGSLSEIVPYASSTVPKFDQDKYNDSVTFTFATNMTHRPLGLRKQDPRTRTFTGITPANLANNGPLLSTNWFALAANEVRTPQAGGGDSTFTSRITPENYELLGDVREAYPGIGGPVHRGSSYTVVTEQPFKVLGELGYIHTGYPWRCLRLRSVVPETQTYSSDSDPKPYRDRLLDADSRSLGDPNAGHETAEADALPDWVVFDMFKIGPDPVTSGRLNLNTRFSGPANRMTPRTIPMQALINATSISNQVLYTSSIIGVRTNFEMVVSNIVDRSLVPSSPYAALPAYFTPGELCETALLGYFADSTNSVSLYNNNPMKENRERIIRRVSNLITARSNNFTIWGMAQAIQEPANAPGQTFGTFQTGTDLITSEVRFQCTVERYEEAGVVKFRPRYFRLIYD